MIPDLSYLSFTEGRVRLRHQLLKDEATVKFLKAELENIEGLVIANFNTRVGSLLFYYDPQSVSLEKLAEVAETCFQNLSVKSVAPPATRHCANKNLGHLASKSLNVGLAATFALTVMSLPLRLHPLHFLAGSIFTILATIHTVKYRKRIF